ncbi:MAG: hypothetical protein Kow00128_24290 [Deltaproteobacteria bacterium]
MSGEREVSLRKEIVSRVLSYEGGEAEFFAEWEEKDAALKEAVREARSRLATVHLPEDTVRTVNEAVAALDVAGHRGDLAILKTARAFSAWRGGEEISADDLRDAFRLALPHRLPRAGVNERAARRVERLLARAFPGQMAEEEGPEKPRPFVPVPGSEHGFRRGGMVIRIPALTDEEMERQAIEQAMGARKRSEAAQAARREAPGSCGDPDCDLCQGYVESTIHAPSSPYTIRKIVVPKGRKLSDAVGKRSRARTQSGRGRYVRSGPWSRGRDVALDATLFRAAASGHVERDTGRVRVDVADLRGKRRERKVGNLILVVLDASASMETQRRMVATKGAVLSLLRDAYVKRDRVGLISFRDSVAEVVVPPTDSVAMAAMQLSWLASGGTTPLSIGIFAAVRTLEMEQVREPGRKPLVVLITDGRANVAYHGGEPLEEAVRMAKILRKRRITSLVIDTDRMVVGPAALRASMEAGEKKRGSRGIFSGGPAKTIADAMGAEYLSLAEMSRSAILAAIRERRVV